MVAGSRLVGDPGLPGVEIPCRDATLAPTPTPEFGRLSVAGGRRAAPKRRWRDYQTSAGRRPVNDFIAGLTDEDAAAVMAGMREVRELGLSAARHLDGDIWEVRIVGNRVIYRVLFAEEGERGRILLALEAFKKKTQKTPPQVITLAKRRLADWRRRGVE